MNKALLYDNDRCRLCGLDGRDHTDECPGRFIDAAQYEVTYSGSFWGRHGETEGYNRADALEDAIRFAGESLVDAGIDRFRAVARIVVDLEIVTAQVKIVRDAASEARYKKRKATEADEQRARSLAALNSMRDDLAPGAYERRYDAIINSADGRGEP